MFQPGYLLVLLLLVAVVSFLSGCYPALIQSGFTPTSVLRKQISGLTGQTRHAGVRKILTISQFAIAQFFILATLIVSQQISYSIDSDMGFDTTAIFELDVPRDTAEAKSRQLLHTVQSLPGVELASTSFYAPADLGVSFTSVSYHNGTEELKPTTQIRWGDEHYLDVYGIKLLSGSDISPGEPKNELLVNEQFTKAIGFQQPEEALGKFLTWNGEPTPIVGIMKDRSEEHTSE